MQHQPWALLLAVSCLLLLPTEARSHEELAARTDNRLRLRLPFFGGGVGQLLHYLRPLEASVTARTELRSELDANHVTYRGWQLWKLNFNVSMEEEELRQRSPDAQFNEVVEKFGE
ncbi:carboxypeptidase O [Drosophila madeirensis]|uniref:Carboxypeptidase O n=1 Tax=Drosophila madeirensis TaxID=30013 RepID=A0AAU9G4W1_DROMD